MQFAGKVVLLAAAVMALPTAAAVIAGVQISGAYPLRAQPAMANMTYRTKDPARFNAEPSDRSASGVEFAQAGDGPFSPPMGGLGGGMGAFARRPHPPVPFDSMGLPPPRFAASPRQGCEEEIDRRAAVAGYLKSRLRLQEAQREAWQKIETAAAPAIETLRALCAELPEYRMAHPSMPEGLDHAEKRMVATAELLHAIREPLRALYATLSPDQRAEIEPPAPPMPPI
jgi:hypothetical protein